MKATLPSFEDGSNEMIGSKIIPKRGEKGVTLKKHEKK